ncbi:basic salivary proline-rich protein 3-like [Heteronotia binoei]|uniref:basic salivary proline-rich protein 3-like n=1 Tax=Heteronotia binoei TaxID=13085 RepID=UPI002930EC8A|nr:basic salivary proline-rich protein 3-like [Heteronotia binoei]
MVNSLAARLAEPALPARRAPIPCRAPEGGGSVGQRSLSGALPGASAAGRARRGSGPLGGTEQGLSWDPRPNEKSPTGPVQAGCGSSGGDPHPLPRGPDPGEGRGAGGRTSGRLGLTHGPAGRRGGGIRGLRGPARKRPGCLPGSTPPPPPREEPRARAPSSLRGLPEGPPGGRGGGAGSARIPLDPAVWAVIPSPGNEKQSRPSRGHAAGGRPTQSIRPRLNHLLKGSAAPRGAPLSSSGGSAFRRAGAPCLQPRGEKKRARDVPPGRVGKGRGSGDGAGLRLPGGLQRRRGEAPPPAPGLAGPGLDGSVHQCGAEMARGASPGREVAARRVSRRRRRSGGAGRRAH